MFAGIVLTTYLSGVGASGLYGIYLSSNDFEAKKRLEKEEDPDICEPQLSEFLRYSGSCATGFGLGLIFGAMWPVAVVGKTFSFINQLDIITKNN